MECGKDRNIEPYGLREVQSAWITSTSISLCLSALDFKQDIEDIYLAGVLVEVQAARKLAATHSFIVAA